MKNVSSASAQPMMTPRSKPEMNMVPRCPKCDWPVTWGTQGVDGKPAPMDFLRVSLVHDPACGYYTRRATYRLHECGRVA